MLTPETIATVKATAPVLAQRGEELTRHFYRRMFAGNPEVGEFFNPANQVKGTQQKALAGAICAFAANVDNLTVLGPAVELIAQKHVSLGIKSEHYPIVGEHLLASIREVLGEAATDEVIDAWAEAYGFLAGVLIGREGELYESHREQHGWEGFKDFVVDRKVVESDCIASFYLKPADGSPLAPHRPGQYLTIRVPGQEAYTTMRNYSLSARPGVGYYRISVKREGPLTPEGQPGHVSNYLHDHVQEGGIVEVGPPCGEFFLDVKAAAEESRPLVFLSGGVGITPVLSMLHEAVEAKLERDIYFIHGAVNGRLHAFGDEARALAAQHDRVQTHFCYSQPREPDVAENRCDSQGFINVDLLNEILPSLDCEYYLCGPKPFMAGLYNALRHADVPESQLNFEFFGPLQDMTSESAACPV
ncbi:NO-inducible flavohemoprotein [Candidatus Laterigemmans baculatus]|uniref:NO-inducible flavohemoprotein n=1 Tax=Candidatus Laterigemmans baculatus TaxID=2770505 RepID=UPI0013DA1A93|nr:NO-inducible flavohemoprotein [Candidatus Laterigemmans baculatus]